MTKKINLLMIMSLAFVLVITGCANESSEILEKKRLVEARTLKNQAMTELISYIGFVEPKEVKNYALKTGGLLDQVNVKSGDSFNAGDILLSLDTYEYGLNVRAASDQLKLAELDMQKAKAARDFYEKTYNDNLLLFENGGISAYQIEQIKLEYDIKTREYEQALKVLNQAGIDKEYKETTLSDTSLIADMDGYVVDLLSKKGELVAQGYPVLIARSKDNIVNIGMTSSDVKRIEIGKRAEVIVEDTTYGAVVSSINMMPDKLSRTFNVELTLDEGDFLIGESAKINFKMDSLEGIWLNITDVLNDGVDYVYVIKDGRASRRDIELLEISSDKVRVSNLEAGERVIISGTNMLSEGYAVKTAGDMDE